MGKGEGISKKTSAKVIESQGERKRKRDAGGMLSDDGGEGEKARAKMKRKKEGRRWGAGERMKKDETLGKLWDWTKISEKNYKEKERREENDGDRPGDSIR